MAEKKPALSPADFFGAVAAAYDHPEHQQFYERVAGELLALLPAGFSPRTILEAGAGTGFATAALVRRFPGAAIEALEPSAAMAARGRVRVPAAVWRNMPLAACGRARFDLVFSSMAPHWFTASEHKQLMRLSAPGGRLALALPVPGAALAGNRLLKQLLGSVPGERLWTRAVRRPEAIALKLEQRFGQIHMRRMSIREDYPDAAALAAALYTRGVLHALFGSGAAGAREALAAADARGIGFEWPLLFIVAG